MESAKCVVQNSVESNLKQANKRGWFLKKLGCCVGARVVESTIRCGEGLETSAFQSLYGGQLTLSTHFLEQTNSKGGITLTVL